MKMTIRTKRDALAGAILLTLLLTTGAASVAQNADSKQERAAVEKTEKAENDGKVEKTKLTDDTVVAGRKLVVAKAAILEDAEAAIKPGAKNDAKVEIVGREIADYRTVSGQGKYIMEDERGELRFIPGAAIESIVDAPDTTLGELRKTMTAELLDEFGVGFSVKSSERYLFVYDASDGYAEWCMRLFDSLSDGFERYAAHNGFELNARVEPMVVVIFSMKSDFVKYASKDTPGADQIAAYYNMASNRVVLYDLSQTEGTNAASAKRKRQFLETKEFLSRPNAAFNVATIVHEATHQIAYNRGVFLRTGPFALWAVEGLSLLFETPNGKASQGGWGYRSSFPTNARQLGFFKDFASTTQQKDPLRETVTQELLTKDTQGFYGTSWAMFYYFYKKDPKALAEYMREVAKRPPGTLYSKEERVADFEKYFGDDWDKLTDNLLRFIKRLR